MDSLINKNFFPSRMIIDKNRIFPVLVMSTVSSGKSTLINAILDREILPNQNEACTAKVYAILDEDENEQPYAISVDSEQKFCRIEGKLKEKLEELNEREDTEKIFIGRQIRGVLNTEKALFLIDTPGMSNALEEGHDQITEDTLQALNGGLVLYLIDATQFGVRDDARPLKLLQNRVEQTKGALRVLFVINKVDELDLEKKPIEDFIPEVRTYLIERGFSDSALIPVSARAALLFRKALREVELSQAEYRDFSGYYERFGTKDLRLSSHAIEIGHANSFFCPWIGVKGADYRISDLNSALDNTGITAVESYIQNAQIQSEKKGKLRMEMLGEQRKGKEGKKAEQERLPSDSACSAGKRTIGILGLRKYNAAIMNMLLQRNLIPEDAWLTACQPHHTFFENPSFSLFGKPIDGRERPYLEIQSNPDPSVDYKLIDMRLNDSREVFDWEYIRSCDRDFDRDTLGRSLKINGLNGLRGYFLLAEGSASEWRIQSCDMLMRRKQKEIKIPGMLLLRYPVEEDPQRSDPDRYVHVPLYVLDASSFSDSQDNQQLKLLLMQKEGWEEGELKRCIFVLDGCEKLAAEGSPTLLEKMEEICSVFSRRLQVEHPILVPVSSAVSSRIWDASSEEPEKIQGIAMECHDKDLECEKYALISDAVRSKVERRLLQYQREKDLRAETLVHTGAYVLETVVRSRMKEIDSVHPL